MAGPAVPEAGRSAPDRRRRRPVHAGHKARDLPGWQTLADALPTRFAHSLAAAIKEAEPKARRVSLPGATIHDQAELDGWLGKVRAEIEKALTEGPVVL
jgi:hypothetical protein